MERNRGVVGRRCVYFGVWWGCVKGIPQCVVHSLYGSNTLGPEDESVESKHVALISYYMFNITTVVFE